jgi:hypothetical protein
VRPAKLEHVIAAGGYLPEETQQQKYHEIVPKCISRGTA